MTFAAVLMLAIWVGGFAIVVGCAALLVIRWTAPKEVKLPHDYWDKRK